MRYCSRSIEHSSSCGSGSVLPTSGSIVPDCWKMSRLNHLAASAPLDMTTAGNCRKSPTATARSDARQAPANTYGRGAELASSTRSEWNRRPHRSSRRVSRANVVRTTSARARTRALARWNSDASCPALVRAPGEACPRAAARTRPKRCRRVAAPAPGLPVTSSSSSSSRSRVSRLGSRLSRRWTTASTERSASPVELKAAPTRTTRPSVTASGPRPVATRRAASSTATLVVASTSTLPSSDSAHPAWARRRVLPVPGGPQTNCVRLPRILFSASP